MPRLVDHDDRKDVLARAVWALVARHGLEVVSMRSVAAQAGVSVGRLQYYFASKDDLLLHSLARAHQWMETRINERVAHTNGTDRDMLITILDELLGEHPDTAVAIRVHAAYAARAADDPRMAAVLTDGDEEIRALAVSVIARSQNAGHTPPDIDPEHDGYALWTLARGLGNDVAIYAAPVQRARETLNHVIQRVTPAP